MLQLLAHPNIASKARVIRIYDHEVQGGTVVKPLTGAKNDGPSDAAVLQARSARAARAASCSPTGINPEYGKLDAYRMAVSVIDEAVRNAVAVGADPDRIAILDNFCWGDPLRPETLGSLVEAARGCYDAALLYRHALYLRQGLAQQRIPGHRRPAPRHPAHPADLGHRRHGGPVAGRDAWI